MTNPNPAASFWRRLLYRWLIEYNPLYLLSAALVLGGMQLMSRGLAEDGSLYQQVGVAAIAELYAFALIGGAALLTRIGLRRPAVLLALVTVLYQGDLTLHTETCAYLGWVGWLGAGAWFVIFLAKLHALAWALKLQLSRSAVAIAGAGAAGLVVLPRFIGVVDPRTLSCWVALWLFFLFAAALWSRRSVESRSRLDDWGNTVLRRTLRATWITWGVLALAHAWFWSDQHQLSLGVLLLAAPLLATRWMRSELRVWGTSVGVLALAAMLAPWFFATAALMVAVTLLLRALRQPSVSRADASSSPVGPYRTATTGGPPPRATREVAFGLASHAALQRLLVGAVSSAYLSAWTLGWSGGPWPAHSLGLDLILTALLLAAAWKARVRIGLLPLTATYVHFVVALRLIPAPKSVLQWGVTSVGVGFGLLIMLLAASVVVRRLEPSD